MSKHSAPPIGITIAYTEGCEHTSPTRVLVEQAAKELGLAIEVRMALVTTEEEAVRYRLHGSPTVLVNGQDADPALSGPRDTLSTHGAARDDGGLEESPHSAQE